LGQFRAKSEDFGMTYPRRQRKSDRLLTPGATKDEIMVDHAVAPFDRECRRVERTWGYDKLTEYVSPDLAAKFGGAMAYLNKAIEDCDPTAAAAAAQNCIKGLLAMEAAATAAGHQPPQALAHGEVDGWAFRIVADAADSTTTPDDGVPVFSLREVGLALKAKLATPLIQEARKHFPNAEVTTIREKRKTVAEELNDEIPW
jgi:hypothetical protein